MSHFVIASSILSPVSIGFSTLEKAVSYIKLEVSENMLDFDCFGSPYNGERFGWEYSGKDDNQSIFVRTLRDGEYIDFYITKIDEIL